MLAESVSHCSKVLNAVMVCLREIIFHLKSMWTEKHTCSSGFCIYEHIYTYRRQEFQNIEIKLCNWFRQLLLIYWTVKKCWTWNWTYFDSTHGVFITLGIPVDFAVDSMNTLKFKKMMNLTVLVCNIICLGLVDK